jgi:hypothetical protein
MKFGEYVGHKKSKEIKKKIVQTSIGPTEEEFLRKVARENPDSSKINTKEFYLGFGVSKKTLKRVYDYIKSWFLRYHIPFKSINPYLTLYVLRNLPSNKRNFIEDIKIAKRDVLFSPIDEGDITFVKGDDIELRLEYDHNPFIEKLESIFEDRNIEIVEEHTYVKLFRMDEMMDEDLVEDMMYSCPHFPDIRIGHIGLLRRR